MNKQLYHEKQTLLQCGVAAVNNLLQKQAHTRKSFNDIANSLPKFGNSFFSDYSNILGNYSADVLIIALQQSNKIVECFDVRKIAELQTVLQSNDICGLLVNKVSNGIFGKSYHWIAIIKLDSDNWFNLDSKQNPTPLSSQELKNFLSSILNTQGNFFFVYNQHQQMNIIQEQSQQTQSKEKPEEIPQFQTKE